MSRFGHCVLRKCVMPLPEPLADFITGARSSIERAHPFNVAQSVRAAATMLQTLRTYVVPTPEMNAAFGDALARIIEFHDEVDNQSGLARKIPDAVENARQIAMLSIEQLGTALRDAGPSEDAQALGLDWQ